MKKTQKYDAKMQKRDECKNCKKIALEKQLSENSTKIGRKSTKTVQKEDGNTIKIHELK